MKNGYDVIIVGVGSMGSAACYYLAKAGLKVLGLEQFNLPHENGSHSGESRFVRMAYFEDPDYVPLLKRSYHNWEHLEIESGQNLFHKTGIVYFGEKDSIQTKGVRTSSNLYNIPIDSLTNAEREKRFHQFNIPDSYECLFEENAGYVQPELTIITYAELAKNLGADIKENEQLQTWTYKDGTVYCSTVNGNYSSKKIIFTAGVWTQKLLPQLAHKLQTTQQALMWYAPENSASFFKNQFCCWSITDPDYQGMFYGFPIFDQNNLTIKIAYHSYGIDIEPDQKSEQASREEIAPIDFFINKYIPILKGKIANTKTCLYNYSPDENFIIDFLPDYDQAAVVACGFSGHGFKFVPMIGELLKDLVLEGGTDLPVEFLKLR